MLLMDECVCVCEHVIQRIYTKFLMNGGLTDFMLTHIKDMLSTQSHGYICCLPAHKLYRLGAVAK